MPKKEEEPKVGSGKLSRKFLLSLGVFLAGVGFGIFLLIVGEYAPAVGALGIAGGAVSIYNGSNAYLGGKYSNHGFPPGLEP